MKINEIENHFKELPINSISEEKITLEGLLLHGQGHGSLNYIDDGTGKILICSIYSKMDSLIKKSHEKSKIRVAGQVERTEFGILGIRVEDFKSI